MQDRYAADVGDYIKFALLRRLSIERTLGVLWWRYPDETHNADGKHVAYLHRPERWRDYDPMLFDALGRIVEQGRRSVSALENADLLPGATYFPETLPVSLTPSHRRSARAQWFERDCTAVDSCDLVFLDPDNGLETRGFSFGATKAGKTVALSELDQLRQPGRAMLVYHHQTRMAGGHHLELVHWGERLAARGFRVDALRAAVGSARAFFLLDAPEPMREAAADFASDWRDRVSWHPALG